MKEEIKKKALEAFHHSVIFTTRRVTSVSFEGLQGLQVELTVLERESEANIVTYTNIARFTSSGPSFTKALDNYDKGINSATLQV
jgi:hypothetical protein